MTISMDDLKANQAAQEGLFWAFDFRVEAHPNQWGGFSVDGYDRLELIGQDGSGGQFLLLPGGHWVLYISSEGAAGIIAADLDAFLALIVACPYWRDLLRYSGDGKLDEMRRAAPVLESVTLEEEDGIEDARDAIKSELGIADPADPVGALHAAVSTSQIAVRAQDGTPYASLFGTFTIEDNPKLRDRAD
jgi:hypothetical protein